MLTSMTPTCANCRNRHTCDVLARYPRQRAGCSLWDRQEAKVAAGVSAQGPDAPKPAAVERRKRKGPNKTEQAFHDAYLAGLGAVYEGLTVRIAGHRYTPDWLVIGQDGHATLYEVKGSYRLHSHGRARLAFDAARQAWPCFRWVWATKQTDGTWRVEG
jgi:hypothetical protein